MNSIIEQILIGSILGDGSISKSGSYQESHCEKQKDYIFWKRKILKKEFKTNIHYYITNKENWSKQNQYRLNTQVSPIFKEYRKLFYPNGKKTIPDKFLNKIGKLAIVVWYFDDGSYNPIKNGIQIHSLCFSLEENQKLQKRLKDFGMNFRIGCIHSKKTKFPYYLFCYGKETDKFLSFIRENAIYIPKSMTYKMGKFNKDNLKWIEEKRKALQNQRHNYRQINKEQLKKIDHEYYIKNQKRLKKVFKEYYQNNKDKWEIYTKRRREHPEKLKEYFSNYYMENKERYAKQYLKRTKERLRNGLCVHCGKKNDSGTSKYSCKKCCNKQNIKDRTKRMEQKLKRIREEYS
jgi:hypothetical protein